ncbi:MAG: hypothetical protein ABF904_13635 [Ethanoligenens sp.]
METVTLVLYQEKVQAKSGLFYNLLHYPIFNSIFFNSFQNIFSYLSGERYPQ